MALHIKIRKISQEENIGFYHVVTEQCGEADFYVGIDKGSQKIYCFLTNNFSNPIRIVDPNDPNEVIGELPGVSARLLGKVFMVAEKIFKLNEFPPCLDYCA